MVPEEQNWWHVIVEFSKNYEPLFSMAALLLGFAIGTVSKIAYRYMSFRHSLSRLKRVEGCYFSDTRSPSDENDSLAFNLLNIKINFLQHVFGLKNQRIFGYSIFSNNQRFDYFIELDFLDSEFSKIAGKWQSRVSSDRKGICFLTIKDDGRMLEGWQIGVSENSAGELKASRMILMKTSDENYDGIDKIKKKIGGANEISSDHFKNIEERKSALLRKKKTVAFGCNFVVDKEGYHPRSGKAGVKLLEIFFGANRDLSGKKILDVGTGCGFYAVCCAKRGAESVVALEKDASQMAIAQGNADKNSVQSKITFISSDDRIYNGLNARHRFDFILINMPFTKNGVPGLSQKLSDTYCIDVGVLFNLIIGASLFLNRGGHIYIAYGDSGYVDQMRTFIKIAGLNEFNLWRSTGGGETFYVSKIVRI